MRPFNRHLPVLCAPVILVVASCTTAPMHVAHTETPSPSQRVTLLPPPPDSVEQVVDARTVVLSNGVKARVLGLAAPGECWSAAALEFAKATLLGKHVRYSRASESAITLRLADNSDYATLAVSQGAARAEKDDPVLSEPEKSAARSHLGLWGPPCQGQDTTPTSAPSSPARTTPAATAPPVEQKKDCAVTYRVAKEWAGGFHAEVIVRNTTQAPVTRWTVRWTFPSGQRIGETWGGVARQFGTGVLAMSQDGNGSISSGGQVTLRFNASTAGPNVSPTAFTLNGKTCSLG